MSVTFWAPDAPTITIVPYPEQDPTFTCQESVLPELRVSNSNATRFGRVWGLTEDDAVCGSIEVAQLDAVIERITQVLNNPTGTESGLHPEQLTEYCTTFLDLLVQARKNDYLVSWG